MLFEAQQVARQINRREFVHQLSRLLCGLDAAEGLDGEASQIDAYAGWGGEEGWRFVDGQLSGYAALDLGERHGSRGVVGEFGDNPRAKVRESAAARAC